MLLPGSAFMIKKDVFVKAGGFDENIFLYFEESDLGKRIRKLGYKLIYYSKDTSNSQMEFWSKEQVHFTKYI